jgi:hypothetical protein
MRHYSLTPQHSAAAAAAAVRQVSGLVLHRWMLQQLLQHLRCSRLEGRLALRF